VAAGVRLVEGVRKIAVLRANAIGDYVFTIPALEALKAAYPEAEIVLLGKSWHQEFLTDRPGPVDRVEVVPVTRGVGAPMEAAEDVAEQEAFFARMVEERFDLAFQVYGGGRYSNPFLRRLGARLTVGLKTADAVPLDVWIPYIYWQGEVARYLEVVRLVGANPITVAPRVTVTEADQAESRRVVAVDDRPLVALHPGASDPERWWPTAKFAAVGDALAAAGARVVVTGTAGEAPLAEAIRGEMRWPAEDTTGRLSVGGLAGLLARCAVVVSNDSGPLHLAAAVGTASVGIYWCFNLINAGPVATARLRPFVSWQITCPVCGIDRSQGRCDHHPSFVAGVPTEDVIETALELLRAETAASAPVVFS
jgi:ADP-heptose:LPS heptosyltransferase